MIKYRMESGSIVVCRSHVELPTHQVTYLLLVTSGCSAASNWSQVLTRCPPLFVVHGIQAVVESRSSREIDNIPQI